MFDLTGKTALVTGSTQGIGFAIAECLSEHGAKVFVHGASNMEKCKNSIVLIGLIICANKEKRKSIQKVKRIYTHTGAR